MCHKATSSPRPGKPYRACSRPSAKLCEVCVAAQPHRRFQSAGISGKRAYLPIRSADTLQCAIAHNSGIGFAFARIVGPPATLFFSGDEPLYLDWRCAMFTTGKLDLRMEAVKYLLLAILATALALLMVQTLSGAPTAGRNEPGMLPADMPQVAVPMNEPQMARDPMADPFMPTVTPDMHDRLWTVLQLHREGQPAGAMILWPQIALPPETAAYKPMAMAVAEMKQHNLPGAERLLMEARDLAPRNALVAYFMGVLRVEQAAECKAMDQDFGPQFAAYVPWDAYERRAMLELAAIMEFRDAIEWADETNVEIELMPDPRAVNLGPLVTDLMTALDADNFVGRAHKQLAELLLRRGALTEAEQHIDAAVAAELPVMFAYEDLGLLYELQGRHADTLRAYTKNFQYQYGPALDRLTKVLVPAEMR
jgi:hypothetical protein